MAGEKTTTQVEAEALPGLPFYAPGRQRGYEIHMGLTETSGLEGPKRPAFRLVSRLGRAVSVEDGQVSADGRVVGTYLHGILDNDQLRAALLAWAGGGPAAVDSDLDYAAFKDKQYDLLADHLEAHVDIDALLEPAGEGA